MSKSEVLPATVTLGTAQVSLQPPVIEAKSVVLPAAVSMGAQTVIPNIVE